MPGRIVQNLKRVKTSNQYLYWLKLINFQLEIKETSSAMLEVLDPEQNSSFYDNFWSLV